MGKSSEKPHNLPSTGLQIPVLRPWLHLLRARGSSTGKGPKHS